MKPILFNTEMARALLDGRKTVTRRVVKPRHGGRLEVHDDLFGTPCLCERCGSVCRGLKPPYQPGDILWVRETWNGLPANERAGIPAKYWYKADEPEDADTGVLRERWRPSIHMPREAARIFLRVTDVRVERLQDISRDQTAVEGAPCRLRLHGGYCGNGGLCDCNDYNREFAELWDSTIKAADLPRYGWDANPWVWVIEFELLNAEVEL